jgi:hypothetical protein
MSPAATSTTHRLGLPGWSGLNTKSKGLNEAKSDEMPKLRVHSFSISIDGYGAGPDQSLENPLGVGGEDLHNWLVGTRTFHDLVGGKGQGATGVDNDVAARGFTNIGAWILGRKMFVPVRRPWPDDTWKGWWGKKTAVSHSCICSDPSLSPIIHKGGEHNIPFRDRRH